MCGELPSCHGNTWQGGFFLSQACPELVSHQSPKPEVLWSEKNSSLLERPVPLPVSWLLLSSAALSVCRSFSQGLCDCRTPLAEELCRSSPSRPRSRG